MRSNLTDIDVQLVRETSLAVLVHTGDREGAVWLPKSQCEIEPKPRQLATYVLTAPESLLIEKGLV